MERFKIPEDQPMEAKILSRQIENAQKKVEEQNFVMRKNVLKYDDVLNTQRKVIYEQRRRVLEGDDMSDQVKEWIDEVVERTVNQFTEEEYAEEWDLDALCKGMEALYGTDITPDELRDENVDVRSREALVDEFREDAQLEYEEKEKELGGELMRELERFIILQVVDQRWREHLDAMDYLREGIHLRGMAQKDPLVEYRNEGHVMFQELSSAIREEVVQVLFHAQLEPAAAEEALAVGDSNGAQPGSNLQYEHQSLAGADAIAAAGAGDTMATATLAMSGGGAVATGPRQIVKSERENLGRNDPCWCGSGKKFKKCHGA
jgi:preprotein translocase subunit SecA